MKILIIEDDVDIAALQRDYLEIAGFEVIIKNDGKDGFNDFISGEYSLVIVDLMLPGMDGFEICKAIRAQSQTPILVVSSKSADIDKIRALGLGADDYMVKPFSPSELVARVQAHIKRFDRIKNEFSDGVLTDEAIFKSGNIKIDTVQHKVLLSGRELNMTNKEYDLLLYMMQNSDKVLSKEELLLKIWGVDAFIETATLTVHINKLRDKIESDKNNPAYIQTIWGIGYLFSSVSK